MLVTMRYYVAKKTFLGGGRREEHKVVLGEVSEQEKVVIDR